MNFFPATSRSRGSHRQRLTQAQRQACAAMILAIAVVYVTRLRGGIWRDPERLKMVMAE
ncbi:MAG TPA: hypothetical protein QGF41_06620 [Gammaproteobacteria bacterium]|nr:hypothetical protein [Gammaproteobacteria bacterium]